MTTSLVEKNCFISKATRQQIMIHATETFSEKAIGKLNDVSPSTVSRVLNPLLYEKKQNKDYLPKHLMVDELKVIKDTEGAAMSFIFADAKTHEIQDLLHRKLHHLETYFRQFPREVRYHVETVTMDMYSPYIQLVQDVFPKAKIILDCFHVGQLLLRALLQTRIQTMKKFPKDSKEYKLLKKYWKHLQKKHKDLDSVYHFYCYHTRSYSTSFEKVEELLEIDEELTKTYWSVHSLIQSFMERDEKRFFSLLQAETLGLSSYVKTVTYNKVRNLTK
jgi:transposase